MKSLRQLWDAFNVGDHLTDQEIMRLIRSAEQGLEYLRARAERLAAAKTSMDLETLRTYQQARKS